MLKFRGKKGLAHKPVRLLMKPKGTFANERPFCSVFISYFLLQVLRLAYQESKSKGYKSNTLVDHSLKMRVQFVVGFTNVGIAITNCTFGNGKSTNYLW